MTQTESAKDNGSRPAVPAMTKEREHESHNGGKGASGRFTPCRRCLLRGSGGMHALALRCHTRQEHRLLLHEFALRGAQALRTIRGSERAPACTEGTQQNIRQYRGLKANLHYCFAAIPRERDVPSTAITAPAFAGVGAASATPSTHSAPHGQ